MADYPQIQALVHEAGENFPVASWLLPRAARHGILHFYALARHADDIADSPILPAGEKIAQLAPLQEAVREQNADAAPEWARPYIRDTQAGLSDPRHGVNLLTAFLQDARQSRYASFAELLDYCRFSAAPVGRVVLECSGETQADTRAADALCMLLQLINHLQDCGKDYGRLNRVYLPQDWMHQHGADDTMLTLQESTGALRAVYHHYLAECHDLLRQAQPLPASIRSRRLRWELAFILEMAMHLLDKLAHEDPLQHPVRIPRWQWGYFLIRSLRRL